ncbi:hypothetical protein WKV53_22710 [Luteolibacter sp. Y139]|uniref:PEP-CTERM protein-sorting domain-containing protein n=2 Tax=Luteolibacter soli TaxID=3135280 RepID=A0ABU9B2B4_9BACT
MLFRTLFGACVLASLAPANGQLLEYSFQAVVDSIDSTDPGFTANRLGLVAGDTITGRIIIDRSSIDQVPGDSSFATYRNYATGGSSIYDPNSLTYQQPPLLFQTSVSLDLPLGQGSFGTVTSSGSGGNLVYDPYSDVTAPRVNVANGTSYTSESGAFGTVSGDALNFYQVVSEVSPGGLSSLKSRQTVDFLFQDADGLAFQSDALPGSLALSDFDSAKIFYKLVVPAQSIQTPVSNLTYGTLSFNAHLVSLNVVPEPSAVGLGAVAVSLLVLFRRRTGLPGTTD